MGDTERERDVSTDIQTEMYQEINYEKLVHVTGD